MFKKIGLGSAVLLSILISGCGNEEAIDGVEAGSESTNSVVLEESDQNEQDSIVEESETEEINETVYRREFSSKDFTFNAFHKRNFEKYVDNYETGLMDKVVLDNLYEEIVGFSISEENPNDMYFLIRSNSGEVRDNVGLTTILDSSTESGFHSIPLKTWNSNGFAYKIINGISEGEGNIVRFDSFMGMSEENSDIELYETVITMEELQELENDDQLEESIGAFEFHQFDNASIIDEPIEFENDTAKLIIHSINYTIDYPADSDTSSSYVEMDIEYFPKKDGDITSGIVFPYSEMEPFFETIEVYKDIPLRETFVFYDTPDLFLEDKLIIVSGDAAGNESLVIDFKKEGYKQDQLFVVSPDISFSGVEFMNYEIIPAVRNESDSYELEIIYTTPDVYGQTSQDQSSKVLLKDSKGEIPVIKEYVGFDSFLNYSPEETLPVVWYEIELRKPDLTVEVQPLDYE